MQIAAYIVIGLLLIFSTRRLMWVIASWLPPRKLPKTESYPSVLVAVAFRNEQHTLPNLLCSLDSLDYEDGLLSICLVDDASTDASADSAAAWAQRRENVRLIHMNVNVGKAEALNRAVALAVQKPDVIVVYDADQRPKPASLRRLVEPFADCSIEAVCGYRRPIPRRRNAVAAYACIEAWTHQLVNLAAKESLGLNPPTMGGNCAYRRSALERIGGFPAGVFSEDIEVSLALSRSGGRTRFVRDAVADHDVADSLRDFVNQRLRWTRGLIAARRHVRGIEAAFVVAGYLDRVVLLLVTILVIAGSINSWWLMVYVVPACGAVCSAVAKAEAEPWLVVTVFAVFPIMFLVDVAVSAWGVVASAAGHDIRWVDRRSAGDSS